MFSRSDYTFDLPTELIAQQPSVVRDRSRLLYVANATNAVTPDTQVRGLRDCVFADIVDLLPRDAVVVANDTRVIPARLVGTKPSGGRVELLLLEPEPETPAPAGTSAWRCLARARRPLRVGQEIAVDDQTALVVVRQRDEDELQSRSSPGDDGQRGVRSLSVAVPGDVYALLDRLGRVPLPRYIRRDSDTVDRDRYQTMFAKHPGAVAAPTAGLHMTPEVAAGLVARGIALTSVTLHVGYGTFEPIRVDDIRDHRMHRERYTISEPTAALLQSGRPIVALGTTALRAVEASRGQAGSGTTDLFIFPGSGHSFIVDQLITNFHLPESSLLMLVCAFAGTGRVLDAYRHAVAARYRFFSYGDAMLVHREDVST